MTSNVFANDHKITCKAADGKAIAAFPDTCFTPPQSPATPPGLPVPYPNTGVASETTEGSKTVRIGGQEILLRDKSYFKTSSGDEAGSAPKKGIVTSAHKGKVYFVSWSMNVQIEGLNVVRHLDITTHNHASPMANVIPWLYQDSAAESNKSCSDYETEAEEQCQGSGSRKRPLKDDKDDGRNCNEACAKAKACILKPYDEAKEFCCHPNTTGHHLIEVHCFSPTGDRGGELPGLENYKMKKAPCVCASKARHDGTHGELHAVQAILEGAFMDSVAEALCEWPNCGAKIKPNEDARAPAVSKWTYEEARDVGVIAHKIAFPHCNATCIKQQLDKYHLDECGFSESTPLRTDPGAEKHSFGDLKEDEVEQLLEAQNSIYAMVN